MTSADLRNLAAARAALADPTTPGEDLATIAELHPSLAAEVAAHPNIYPDLLTWLREYRPSELAQAPAIGRTVGAAATTPLTARAPAQAPTPAFATPSQPGEAERRSGTNPVLLAVLVALAVGGVAFGVFALWSSSQDGGDSAATEGATASEATPVAPPETTPAPTAPSSDPAPTTPEATTPQPAPTTPTAPSPSPISTPSGAAPAELSQEYCGPSGTISVLAQTARFEVSICRENEQVYYSGVSKESGDSIRLDAYMPDGPLDEYGTVNFMADNGEITYRLTDWYLMVYDGGELVMQEAVTSWQEWY